MIISIDETNVSQYESKRRTWINKNENLVIEKEGIINSLSATLVIATCQTEVLSFHLFKGSLNQVNFLLFLHDRTELIKKKFPNCLNIVYIFDNLKAHRTRLIKSFCIKNRIEVVFTPKYSPEVNFVENVINRLKQKLRRKYWKSS